MIDFKLFRTKAEIIKYLKEEKSIPCKTSAQAEKYLREHLPKESYYQNKIIKHIKKLIPTAFVWKAAACAYSRQGIPDICAIINGRYYGFEVKRPFVGVLSEIQKQTIRQIRDAGGKAYVVTYPDEVTEILEKEKKIMEEEEGGLCSNCVWSEDKTGSGCKYSYQGVHTVAEQRPIILGCFRYEEQIQVHEIDFTNSFSMEPNK